MMMSMYSGVAGIKSQQTKLNVIGNNISNINTLGYKGQSVAFSDMLSQTVSSAQAPGATQGGRNAAQIGTGVSVAAITSNMKAGSTQATGSDSDVALTGNGFFVVKQGSDAVATQYTRAGNFGVDTRGNLVVNGLNVCGWTNYTRNADGTIEYDTTQGVGALNIFGDAIEKETVETVATSGAIFAGTLDASSAAAATITKQITVYDAEGNPTQRTVTLTHAAGAAAKLPLKGSLYTSAIGAPDIESTISIPNGSGTNTEVKLKFVQDGANPLVWTCSHVGSADPDITLTYNAGTGTFATAPSPAQMTINGNTVDVDFSSMTGGGSATAITADSTAASAKSTWTWTDDATPANIGTVVFNAVTGEVESGAVGNTVGGATQDVSLYFSGLTCTVAASDNAANLIASGHVGGVTTTVLNKRTMEGSATTQATLSGNLDIAATTGSTTLTMYDSEGAAHEVKVTFSKSTTMNNLWTWTASSTDKTIGVGGQGTLLFDSNGAMVSGSTGEILVATTNGSEAIVTALDLSGIGQFASSTGTCNVAVNSINGYTGGNLQDYSVGADGVIMGSYSNGLSQAVGMLGLAVFNNPTGLKKIGDNLYETTVNSGGVNTVAVGESGTSLATSSLEMSNVDLASEFSEMMITQRAYQANSKIITTSDTLLETLINMSR
ncbi:flagellar hook-basal body complex protein [Anaeromusa sp.]|uniref:flagellar hook-basal body complex protein n=1 Tax=Anaeromusa sp. TaxID=1872520 RepID=UPI00260858DE|nr:flagellar hook-basal body complex protein [Anaeromusa sp.]MDD3158573.1 flagellar hook-basal body complex protein [Anaeromusa sp.]